MKNRFIKGNADHFARTFSTIYGDAPRTGDTLFPLREAAMQQFADTGYASTSHEEWKYTDVTPLTEPEFKIGSDNGTVTPEMVQKYLFDGLENARIVFVNGAYSDTLSDLGGIDTQVQVKSMRRALQEDRETVLEHLNLNDNHKDQSFVAMNTALFTDGVYINVPANVLLDKPVHLIYLTDTEGATTVSFPRNLIITGRSSQAEFIETYAGKADQVYLTNSVSEIVVGENARVHRYKIQMESDAAFHISNMKVVQERNSRFADYSVSIGGKLVRNNLDTEFAAEGAESELNGLYTANGRQLVDNHTTIDHAKPHCESHELYKGILDGHAKGVFNGKIFVRPDAQKTNAIQNNNCILLSDDATIDTKPQLEIFADDVKCTHGATVGQLNDEAFFYMRARGIEKNTAKNMLIFAFASEVLDKIKLVPVREKMAHLFSEKLHTFEPGV